MGLYSKEEISNKIAEYLLKVQAVSFHTEKPIKWASGMEAPIYCDNRIILSHPTARTFIRQALADLISEEFEPINAIVGVATGGIPHGVLAAQSLEVPFAYVRPTAKDHGKTKLIEGHLNSNDRVVIVEDLISTAQSTLKVFNILKENNFFVAGIVSIFSYMLPIGLKNLKQTNCTFHSLCDYPTLIKTAERLDKITNKEYEILSAWRSKIEEVNI